LKRPPVHPGQAPAAGSRPPCRLPSFHLALERGAHHLQRHRPPPGGHGISGDPRGPRSLV